MKGITLAALSIVATIIIAILGIGILTLILCGQNFFLGIIFGTLAFAFLIPTAIVVLAILTLVFILAIKSNNNV